MRTDVIARYVMVSSMGANPEAPGNDTFSASTGLINAGDNVGRAEIPRDDVAATLLAVLHQPDTIGITFELIAGDVPIAQAVPRLVA